MLPPNKSTEFHVDYYQFLNETGKLTQKMPSFIDNDKLKSVLKAIILTRTFDAKAIELQRTGQLGTYPSSLGEEAISVATGFMMQPEDVLCPYYRDHGAFILRGIPLAQQFQFWGGDERGANYLVNQKDFPPAIPIATQCTHAAGVATAMKLRHEPHATLTSLGDGATSKGDFYEALNLAGVWQLPLVFVIHNNQWAISVPLEKQTHTKTLAQKAIAGEVHAYQVDGNDIIACLYAVNNALMHARHGDGPALIEAISYRMSDHTTADNASRYRSNDQLKEASKKDPLNRLKTYLLHEKIMTPKAIKALEEEAVSTVNQAAHDYLAIKPQSPHALFEHLYEELPKPLTTQLETLLGEDHANTQSTRGCQ